jgi:hypothetical protein
LWPYIAGNKPATEVTAWCSIVLRNEPNFAAAAADNLIAARNEDGGWCTEPHSAGHSDWTSAAALLAVRILRSQLKQAPKLDKEIEKSLRYAFDSRTEFYGSLARMLIMASKGEKGLQYARGWPWSPDCFHWVEPTSYALLSLKIPSPPAQTVYSQIIDRANAFMLEHECVGGGWNHGSNICLGVSLPPYVLTTSEALIALQDLPVGEPQKTALAFVKKTSGNECAAIERAWTILALNAYGEKTDSLTDSLIATQNSDGSFGINMLATAFCALALEPAADGTNALKYRGPQSPLPEYTKVQPPPSSKTQT